jgi:C_GCAxxG_C_C family probable redox protein
MRRFLDKANFDRVAANAGNLDFQNYHGSESMVVAVGEYVLGEIDPTLRRISTAFGGGYGKTREEACGALSGGVLLIGALYGRLSTQEDDTTCLRLTALYRERFVQQFEVSKCRALKEKGYGSPEKSCALIISGAARLLLDVLAEYEDINN